MRLTDDVFSTYDGSVQRRNGTSKEAIIITGWSQSACRPFPSFFRGLSSRIGAKATFRKYLLATITELFFQFRIISTGELQAPLHTCLVTIWYFSTCHLYWQKILSIVNVGLCVKISVLSRIFWDDTQIYYCNNSFQTDSFCQRGRKLLLVSVYVPPILGTASGIS